MTDPLPHKDRADPLPTETATRETVPLPHRFPERIGRYHIKRVIASGGMGTVYEATQDNPRRVVAVKVMKQGIASKSALRRFEYEGQILGRLRHPGIAQIYEAGTHHDPAAPGASVPYFAMEYIPNAKLITHYADEKKLGTRQRMELFAKVCDAIHHGHQKGIIHRDLKPSNILVTSDPSAPPLAKGGTGGVGQVKIIDFGVARCTDSDLAVTTLQTDVGQLIGTLQYMSPEQCEGDPHDIDTRSDVYALGVVFYQLLCGKLPYDVTRMAMHQATRAIREQHPTKLSTLDKTLRGDVETIALKALEKERERRYQSAADFGHDIQRYLTGEAITARRASIVYQLRLFARRKKGVFASLAALFIVLSGATIVSTTLYWRAEREQSRAEAARLAEAEQRVRAEENEARAKAEAERARKERDKAEHVAKFISDTLLGVSPSVALGRDATMLREMMDAAAKRIHNGELVDAPEAELQLRGTIGTTYLELAVYDRAADMLEPALVLAYRLYGEEHPHVATSLNNLALLLRNQHKLSEAEPLYREALAMRRKLLGEEHQDVANSLNDLAGVLDAQGKLSEAEALLRESLAMGRKLLGEEHPDVAMGMNNLAGVLQAQGKLSDAEPLLRESLATFRNLLGEEHPHVAMGVNNLARLLQAQGKLSEAEPLFREALAMGRKLLGEEHVDVATGLNNLASLLRDRGELSEAEPLYREAVAIYRKLLGEEHPIVANSLNNLASLLVARERWDEAEQVAREGNERVQAAFPEAHWRRGQASSVLGSALAGQGKFAEAEPLLLEGYTRMRNAPVAPPPARLKEALERIVRMYESWDAAEPGKGYAEKAAQWRAKLDEEGTKPRSH